MFYGSLISSRYSSKYSFSVILWFSCLGSFMHLFLHQVLCLASSITTTYKAMILFYIFLVFFIFSVKHHYNIQFMSSIIIYVSELSSDISTSLFITSLVFHRSSRRITHTRLDDVVSGGGCSRRVGRLTGLSLTLWLRALASHVFLGQSFLAWLQSFF